MNRVVGIWLICCLAILQSNTRVAFSRPGSIIRTTGNLDSEYFDQYIIGFGGEITHFGTLNYSFANYFQGITSSGYSFGLSYTTGHKHLLQDEIASNAPSNVSFHIHKQLLKLFYLKNFFYVMKIRDY